MKEHAENNPVNGVLSRIRRVTQKKPLEAGGGDLPETNAFTSGGASSGGIPTEHPDAYWPVSIVGAFAGMLAGTLPAAVWGLIFGASFSPLYLLIPLFVYWGIKLLRGFMGMRGFILTAVFSLLGMYLTALSAQAVREVLRFKMSVFNLPLVTITMIGEKGALPSPAFSSANVFPVIFTAIGAAIAYELLMRRGAPRLPPKTMNRRRNIGF